jgi:iron(II)-dependent oxidoreductase
MTTEVTAGAYEACRAAGACSPTNPGGNCNSPQKPEHPVNCVDHAQARAFCLWVGGRLPTAVEWEYAAKSGQAAIYAWGNGAPTQELANFGQAYTNARGTDAVGSHPAGNTPWGLKDMTGNVWEWTASRYDAKTIEVRGGGWVYGPTYQRSSFRNAVEPGARADYLGFRCAR